MRPSRSLPSSSRTSRRTSRIVTLGVLVAAQLAAAPPDGLAQGLFAGTSSPPPQTDAAQGRRIEAAQRLLARLGYHRGAITNTLDPTTSAAVRAFQSAAGLPADGRVTEELLRALRKAAWERGGWGRGEARGQDEVVPAEGIREAQRILTKLGYEPGPADGTFGPQTMSAVESYQAAIDINVDGLVTRNVLDNLRRSQVLKPEEVKGTLRILNWPDYVDPALLERFERETKIRVIHDVFSGSDELEARLAVPNRRYDLAVPSGNMIGVHAAAGHLQPLDKSKIRNLDQLAPEIVTYTEVWDPGGRYGIPYMWGTTGLAVDRKQLAKRAPGAAEDSLSLLFEESLVAKMAPCGVRLIDAPDDVIPTVLLWLGKDPASADPAVIREAGPVLQRIRPHVDVIDDDRYVDESAEGKVCLALGYSGDTLTARDAARAAKRPIDLVYRLPAEGASLWFDFFVIPKSAPEPANAHAFLGFLLDPKVIGQATNYTGYANANAGAKPFVDPKLLADPNVFPPREAFARLRALPTLTPAARAEMDRIWQDFRK